MQVAEVRLVTENMPEVIQLAQTDRLSIGQVIEQVHNSSGPKRNSTMHAIVRQGNGQYYISAVFGFFMHDTKIGGYKNVADKINHSYWVVWDPEKKRLIRRPVADHGGIIPQVLAIDTDQSCKR